MFSVLLCVGILLADVGALARADVADAAGFGARPLSSGRAA